MRHVFSKGLMQVLSLSLDGRSSRTSLMRSRSQDVEPQRLMTVRFELAYFRTVQVCP